MTNQPTEIAIAGVEMVGGALALGLAQHGLTVTVIEHAEPAPFVADSRPDVRISVINTASVSLLKGLGVWSTVQTMCCHPYRRLETWGWEAAHVVFDAAELKLPLLDYMVGDTVLRQVLWQTLEAHPKVALHVPGSLIALHRHDDLQGLELKGRETIRAKLVIGAGGANSQIRQIAGIGVRAWQYAQSCMLISVQCENDPGDNTWQQFTPDGLRAFLPLFDNQASLVRYDSPARIRQLQSMDMAQLQAKIAKHFLSHLGYVTPLAAGAFPLTRRHALQYVRPGLTLVGDAAHAIHPLTGQEVDLGYRDADALIDILIDAHSHSKTWASYPILKRYQIRHMTDNFIMQSNMDLSYTGFSNSLPPLHFMYNLRLVATECAGVLRRQALKYALGLQPYNIAGCVLTVGRTGRGSVASDIER